MPRDDLPTRSRQQGTVRHRAREHGQALPDRLRLRHRGLPVHRRQPVVGEEFGPYIIKADKTGKVLAVFDMTADGKPVRSPEHYAVRSSGAPGATLTNVNLRRSKGYEGFAASKDGEFIYGLLEGPISRRTGKRSTARRPPAFSSSTSPPKVHRPLLALCIRSQRSRHRRLQYADATTGLVIERDNGEGTPDKACPGGQRGENCSPDIAKFKRVYKIELSDANVGKAEGRLHRPFEDPGSKQESAQAFERRRADIPLLHDRDAARRPSG